MRLSINGKYTFFYSYKDPMSNWHLSEFVIDMCGQEMKFNCSEQYMMFAKAYTFGDTDSAIKIMNTPSPREQKELGRKVKGFDPLIWDSVCRDIMVRGLVAKFESTPELEEHIIQTGDTVLVEASPYDKIWGVGLGEEDPLIEDENNWQGKNLLGIVLMEARDKINQKRKFYENRESALRTFC